MANLIHSYLLHPEKSVITEIFPKPIILYKPSTIFIEQNERFANGKSSYLLINFLSTK